MSDVRQEGFRGNVFGGFNRKDVLQHVEQLYQELARYREENESLQARCEALEAELSRSERQKAVTIRPAPVKKATPKKRRRGGNG